MRYPKKSHNRLRKTLIPDQISGEAVAPKKSLPMGQSKTGKKLSADWRSRWFLSILAVSTVMGLMAMPVRAQNAPDSGPVQFPASVSTATNAPAVSPSQAPSITNPAMPATPPTGAVFNATPSTPPADAGDIHDIRGPISIPYEWLWAAYVVAGMLAAAAIYGLWRWFRRRVKAKVRLPHEIALERLEAARALMTPETVREFAFTVSEVVRVYIEQCFGEKAARRTTEEFLSDLLQQTGTPLAQHRRRLEDFLEYCDLMKFARWGASVREMESMLNSARDFILDTRPQPEPAKAATPTARAQPELVQTP